jgi:HPt (histidine-containing phosphotransfer) domain-containing protein
MPDNQQPLDFSYLIEMVGDDPVFLIEFFETFIIQTPIYLAEISDALASENWSKVANCAHKIKPTFSYIGRNDVKEFVQTIEHNARNMISLEKIASDIERLEFLLVQVYDQLEVAKKEMQTRL